MKKIQTFFNEICSFSKKDILTVLIIVLLYGILSFYKLGNLHSPNTFYRINKGEELIFEFERDETIKDIKLYNGERTSKFTIYTSLDNENYEEYFSMNPKGVFTWNDIQINRESKYIKFKITEDTSLGEVAFYNQENKLVNYSSMNEYLQDEQKYIPEKISYMNSTYFDEIYFARTAYEYYKNIDTYEWTHPPLGKIIQAIPIYITHNFSPFTYRLMGNIAGIIMLVIIYIFGALLFKKRGYAITSAIIMALDTFHFAHTRMGTVDSHLVLFIMISVLMMFIYLKNNKTRYLIASGLFFGLSICVKWTGFYAGMGLAIIYFYDFIKNKKSILDSIAKGSIFFVAIPVIIYCSIFMLFPNNLYHTNTIKMIIKENKAMYNYHANLNAEHFFSSKWYTWPISYKPVWYHQQDVNEKQEETISGVGNLFIWISGIFAFFYALYKMIRKKDINMFCLVVMILSLWLPYIFIGRVMFLYHYFPVLPFLYLLIVNGLQDLQEKLKIKSLIPIYLFSIFLFFITYYPVVSGMPISKNYANDLELFDSWYF